MFKIGEGFIVSCVYRYIDFEFRTPYKPESIRILWSHHDRCGEYLEFASSPEWKGTIEDDDGVIHARAVYSSDFHPLQYIKFNLEYTGLTYEGKFCHFTLQLSDQKCALQSLASVELNLSDFADKKVRSHEISLEMLAKHEFIMKAILKLTLRFDLIEVSQILHGLSNEKNEPDSIDMRLIEEILLCQDDIIFKERSNFDKYSQVKFIVFIFNPPLDVIQKLNALYTQIRLHFKDKIEMFHVSRNTPSEQLLPECVTPVIRSHSHLGDKLMLRFNITLEEPCIVGVSVGNGGSSETVYSSKAVSELLLCGFHQVIEQWLDHGSCSSPSILSNDRNRITLDVQASSLMLNTDVTSHEKGYVDLVCKQSEAQELGIEVAHILRAQLDIRQTLFKRGVSGLTGKWWRLRLFDYQKDGKIIYIDPSNNEIKGYIDLFDVIKFEKVPENPHYKNKACFNIVTLERVYALKAWSSTQMDAWINAATILRTVFLYLKANVS